MNKKTLFFSLSLLRVSFSGDIVGLNPFFQIWNVDKFLQVLEGLCPVLECRHVYKVVSHITL